MNAAAFVPAFRQIGLGASTFGVVLAVSLPLALMDRGMALGAAVGVASVLVALFARRLRFALIAAALLAVLGAFAATQSIHMARHHAPSPQGLAQMAPAAGTPNDPAASIVLRNRDRETAPASLILPARAEIVAADGTRSSLTMPAGWTVPAALFVFWIAMCGVIAGGRIAARHVNRALAAI
jgi:hypothetical protein